MLLKIKCRTEYVVMPLTYKPHFLLESKFATATLENYFLHPFLWHEELLPREIGKRSKCLQNILKQPSLINKLIGYLSPMTNGTPSL